MRGGEEMLRRMFEPLGYEVTACATSAAAATSALTLVATDAALASCSRHLYVLLPVLDDEKHYWVDAAEIEKLMRARRGLAARAPRAGR